MSLLSSKVLTLEVGPHGVSLGRHGVAQMLSLDNLAAALDALPAEATPRRAALQVTVDNAWARWQVIEVPPGVVGHDEQHALVRARMIEVFGSAAQGWVFSWDARPAASVLACALDAALVQRLQAWCVARSVKLKSMQPAWLRAYAGLRGDAATGGFAQLRHGWLCMGLWAGGRWLHVRGEALADPAGIGAVLERRLSLFDGELSAGQLFLHGSPSVTLPRGWRCVAGGGA